ncbi:GGDEF domain-containing protein [Parasphingorhabdus pacifica]
MTAAAGWAATACRLHTRTHQLHRAHRDPVTGLLTRGAWEPAAQAGLRHHDSALGLIDLDEFKTINDTYGHKTGDQVLRAVATRLRTELGHPAVVGRLGGDELAFVTRPIGPGQLDNLLVTLTAPIPVNTAGLLRVGISLGISTLGHRAPLSDALAAADLAMYEAKARRGGWRLHAPHSLHTPFPQREDPSNNRTIPCSSAPGVER